MRSGILLLSLYLVGQTPVYIIFSTKESPAIHYICEANNFSIVTNAFPLCPHPNKSVAWHSFDFVLGISHLTNLPSFVCEIRVESSYGRSRLGCHKTNTGSVKFAFSVVSYLEATSKLFHLYQVNGASKEPLAHCQSR